MYPGAYAEATPDKPAIVMASTGRTTTYGELEGSSTRLARWLRDRGLGRGDVVAVVADNDPRYLVAYWATQRTGMYVTAVNHHLAVEELAYILRDSGAKALIVSASKADRARDAADRVGGVDLRLAFSDGVEGFAGWDEALADVSDEPLDEQPRGADMLYSSGTTGRPKGIRPSLPDRSVEERGDPIVAVFAPRYGFDEDTVYLSPAPLYHAAPLRFCASIHATGGTVVVMERFDAEAALAAIDRYAVTHSQWVPTMFVRMLKLPDEVRERYDVSTMRVAVHAAAPCPPDVKRAMIDWWGPILEEYYAGTEANGITMISSDEWLEHPGSVGRAALGTIRICDEDGRELPPGEVGRIYFERDEIPFEYHDDPAKTAASRHPDHPTWTAIGDLGYVDEDGWLTLTDREAFTIITGGVNVYPAEIEAALILHPKVLDVAVIGVPDEEMGESVKAVVELAPDVEAGPGLEHELIDHCRARLAHFKAPRSVDVIDELPRTPTGKLVKGDLLDAYR